jgi:hypothetical protein
MKAAEISSLLKNQIEEDRLEDVANNLMGFCKMGLDDVDKQRCDYVQSKASHIKGQLAKLHEDTTLRRTSSEEQTRQRNDIRHNISELLRILNDPNFVPPGMQEHNWMIFGKKVGKTLLIIYALFFVVVLTGVFFVFRLVIKNIPWDDNQITYIPANCTIECNGIVQITPTAENFSQNFIGSLEMGETYKVLEAKKQKFGPSDIFFFKVYEPKKNVTGWVKSSLHTNASPSCYEAGNSQ